MRRERDELLLALIDLHLLGHVADDPPHHTFDRRTGRHFADKVSSRTRADANIERRADLATQTLAELLHRERVIVGVHDGDERLPYPFGTRPTGHFFERGV